ncbi:MAG: gamma-glutamyltransferase [Robiginitomaculum sp.]|nr:gamma-glutamyltransferase [Robiginitomaculum sp.]
MRRNFIFLALFGLTTMSLALTGCAATETSTTKVSAETAQMAAADNPHGKGMVVAANSLAVEAGIEALRAGGSAIDAAIAVQVVLGLVEPQSSGIAGGAFLVFYDAKTGKVTAYNGREKAPATIDESLFLGEDGKPLRYFDGIVSGRSTGVPGVIAMLNMVHEDHGKRPWSDNFSSGIQLAEGGFVVSPRMAMLVKIAANYALKNQKAAREYFFTEDGSPIEAGFLRDNKPYAASLRAIAQDYRAMYEGSLAEAIIAAVQEEPRPGLLTLEDMKNYQPQKTNALCSPYRGYVLCGAMPPSSGGVAVQSIMGQLANFDMKDLGPTLKGWHVFAEASAMAYADRDLYVADPDFVDVPTKALLNTDYLKSRAGLISMATNLKNVKAGNPVDFKPGKDATPDVPGTSHFSIVDKWGNVVSMTTTVESLFGSQRMAGGFMLNNQLTDFSFAPRDEAGVLIANRPGPGKRPRSSMAPHVVFDQDGGFAFATGSPGGSSIIAYTAKTMVAMIDWGMSPQEAADLANVISRNGSIRLEEAGLDPETITGLEALGHKVIRSKGEISGIHIIRKNPDGTYEGGADPRREGIAKSE